MSSDVCKHCTHAACLDVCPTGSLFRTRVRHRRGAGRHLQRLRLLRRRLPLRRDRPPRGPEGDPKVGHRPEVHALLRPAQRRPDARPARRPARPSRSSTATSTSCASAPPRGWSCCTSAGVMDAPALRQRPRGRRRRHRRVLPAARRAGGLRPAARPGRDDQGPAADVHPRRDGGHRDAGRRGAVVREEAAVSEPTSGRGSGTEVQHGGSPGRSRGSSRGGDRVDGAGGRLHLLLRPADRQGRSVGARHRRLPLHRRARRRLLAARGRRGPDRPAGAATRGPDRLAHRAGCSASSPWSTTSASPAAS